MVDISSKGTALITGASQGIGAIYADQLARRGFDLILVARNRRRLDDLAERLADQTGRRVTVLAADLANKADLARVEQVLRAESRITLLLNNAGMAATKPLLETDVDGLDALIALNVTALIRLTYAAAPGFAARGGGTIINICSSVGVKPEALNGVYGASKAFVLAFTQSLQHELAGKNIRIQAVLPGVTETETPLEHVPPEIVMQGDVLVDAALAGLDQGEVVTIPSLPNAADWLAYEAARQNLFPNLSRNTAAARYRQGTGAAASPPAFRPRPPRP